jgi:hypothetical protein
MNRRLRIISRTAVFAALVFILSYFSVYFYNVNPAFFLVFAAGFLWGYPAGLGVGIIGWFLWSNFNPFGPAPFPLLTAQIIGISCTAVIGHAVKRFVSVEKWNRRLIWILALAGFLSGLLYHLPVDITDAALYQPFWPRLIGGLIFSLITIVSNSIIFPLFYPALVFLHRMEKKSIL